jgi:hypothetical protein
MKWVLRTSKFSLLVVDGYDMVELTNGGGRGDRKFDSGESAGIAE